jgi:hypothetical protein
MKRITRNGIATRSVSQPDLMIVSCTLASAMPQTEGSLA